MKKVFSLLLCLILVVGCFPLTALADDTTIEGDGETSISLTTTVPYTIAVSADPADGGTVSGGGTYNENESVTVTATANNNYTFVKWTENGEQVSTDASYTFTATADRTLVAVFQQMTTYTVTLTANPSAGGTVTGAGTYPDGETVTVSASANSGYRFDHWERGDGSFFVETASHTFILHDNISLVAIFVEDSTNTTKYTLQMPASVTVTPNEEFTAATAALSELFMATGSDGRTPVRLRVILSSGTLINEADNSKTITFHPDSTITTYPAFNQCMLDFTSAENRTFYVRIDNSSWTSATPGTYTGTMSYIVRWLYDDNSWSGDIETGTIPVTVTIPEQATVCTVTVQPGEGTGTAFTVDSTTVISHEDMMAGNYDQTKGCFYLDSETVYYMLPTKCAFTAPENKEFDCWQLDSGSTYSGGSSLEAGNITITALYKDQEPEPSVTLSIPATINVKYGDTETPFDIKVKSAVFSQGYSRINAQFYNSSFSSTAHDGTIPFTVTLTGDTLEKVGISGNAYYFSVTDETAFPCDCQGKINITSAAWAAAKPGNYTATLRVAVVFGY